jgi:hypothetical protein
MKLYETIVTEKKRKGDKSPVKQRPILVLGVNAKDAKQRLETYWGKETYKWTSPNMIADFNPK